MRPSEALALHRTRIRGIALSHRVSEVRVFGSALREQDAPGSDLDLLVDPLPGATLFDLGGLQDELEELLGVAVDLVTPEDLPARFRDSVAVASPAAMTDRRLADYLDHMRQAVADARGFVEGMDKSTFLQDKRTQQAVVMSLIVLGEVATKVMERFPAFAETHHTIPWRSMRGMRNRIAHGYFDINLEVVWNTTQTALPVLLDRLSSIDH